jgi:hypothetical protein
MSIEATRLLNAAKQALEALESTHDVGCNKTDEAIASLRQAIEQAEKQEPVNWSVYNSGAEVASGLTFSEAWDYLTPERLAREWCAVCVVDQSNMPTTPQPQREWVGLTNNDLQPIAEEYRILFGSWVHEFARAIEAKLKQKNVG